jgi:hypothetical protein
VPYLSWQTVKILRKEKAKIVFVQCPSIFLATFLILIRPYFRYILVVDQHNETIKPFNYHYGWYHALCRFIIRKSDLNIVTNKILKNYVELNGGRGVVLHDKIPCFIHGSKRELGPGKHIVFICTYSPDEPFDEVFKAAALLSKEHVFHVTGNSKKISGKYSSLPANINITGFLSEDDFLSLLLSCDAIIDLTYMDDCLVCGAYEAVGVGKPMVLTDTEMLKIVFNKGAVYCQNNSNSIRDAVIELFSKKDLLQVEVDKLKNEMIDTWIQQKEGLIEKVGSLSYPRQKF